MRISNFLNGLFLENIEKLRFELKGFPGHSFKIVKIFQGNYKDRCLYKDRVVVSCYPHCCHLDTFNELNISFIRFIDLTTRITEVNYK
jgi:hypothetical protein